VKQPLLILICFLFVIHIADGQDSRGSIEGVVANSEDHQPLVGTTILLQGTVLGTTTDADGKFILKNVPVGEYTVTFSMVGFQRTMMANIPVKER